MTYYTVMVSGSPIEGSTSSLAEARANLKVANKTTRFDGEAYIKTSKEPIAS